MQPRSLDIALLTIMLFGVRGAASQEKEALFLPQDLEVIDQMTVRGTTEYPLQTGLSRIAFPYSNTIYYVINEVAALQSRISDRLGDIERNDSDISISHDRYRSEFVHLRLHAEIPDARYFKVDASLAFQLQEYFDTGGYANGSGAIDYLEYQMPIESCPELPAAIRDMENVLQVTAGSIGSQAESMPSERSDEIVVDGNSYLLRVRMGATLEGRFSVNENIGRLLFYPAHAIMMAIRECGSELEPELRQHDF